MNYPPGMSRSDYDHVNGVVRCCWCDTPLPETDQDGRPLHTNECPGGCHAEEPDAAREAAYDKEHQP